MQLPQPFDASKVEPSSGFPPPPPLGDYHVQIIESEFKPTKDNPANAGYLELVLAILDGQYQGRKVIDRLNLFNPNKQTVDIAYAQMSAYCYVTHVQIIQDSRQFHNIPFIATIGPQADNPQFAKVYQIKDATGVVPGAKAAAPAAPQAQPPATPPAAAPWGPPQPAAAQPAAAAPPWGAPAAPAQAAPAAPAWGPPAPQQPPPAANGAPPWQPNAAPAAAPPWAK